MSNAQIKEIHPVNLDELVSFNPGKFKSETVHACAEGKEMVLSFEQGQFIPVHTPPVDLTLYVIRGAFEIAADEQDHSLGPGELISIPRNVSRGVRAKERSVALAFVTPLPTEAHHVQVEAGLRDGVFRPAGPNS